MAPEVIQEVGYDCMADIWSLGITCLEMAEGRPPHADIHPMRAIFMIPTRPAPTVRQPQLWTNAFVDFLSCCLVKAPDERQPARQLLTHPFIMNAGPVGLLVDIIEEAAAAAAANASREPSVTSSSAHSVRACVTCSVCQTRTLRTMRTTTAVVRW
jgi:serine/threonine kinase 3